MREAVFARDRWTCLLARHGKVLGTVCHFGITPHHLLKESKQGEYSMVNLITLCAAHNDAVELHPTEALEMGLTVARGIDHVEAAERRRRHRVVP